MTSASGTDPPTGLHADALRMLSAWTPPDPAQEVLRSRYLRHLSAHPDGLQRSCVPDHLTAGVLVLDADAERVLLNLHRRAQRWFAFGGHCEAGDLTLGGVALREGIEESGIDALALDPVPVDLDEHVVEFCATGTAVHHLDVRFTARCAPGAEPAVSAESLDVRWWPVEELPADLEDEMRVLVARSVARWRALTA